MRNDEIARYDIMIILDHYLPGRLAGGPVTTIANLVSRIGGSFKILVVTQDHDLDGAKYIDIELNTVKQFGEGSVIYLSAGDFSPSYFEKLAQKHEIPLIYLNSFFSPSVIKTLLARRFGKIRRNIILAPRGEFSSGALKIKSRKKEAYLSFFHILHLYREVDIFQASSYLEEADIWRVLGPVRTHVAPDIPAAMEFSMQSVAKSEPLRIVFISRISPKKNLAYAIEVIQKVNRPVIFDIYGPYEDKEYWRHCQELIDKSPPHVQINHRGSLEHHDITKTFSRYAAFLFPTLGENYGHVILEALASGCPVIVSDTTPWQDLASQGVGWVLPLSHQETFVHAVEQILAESIETRQARAERCVRYAQSIINDPGILSDSVELFCLAIEK